MLAALDSDSVANVIFPNKRSGMRCICRNSRGTFITCFMIAHMSVDLCTCSLELFDLPRFGWVSSDLTTRDLSHLESKKSQLDALWHVDMPHLGTLTALCQAWHCWSCGVCGGSNFRSPDTRGMCSSLGKMAMACESNWNARWSWKNEKLTCHRHNGQDESKLKQDPVTIPFVKECLVIGVCFPASGWAPP